MRVFIHGSCVSNDIFSLASNTHKRAAYVPRLSMAAAFGKPAPDHIINAAKKNIESLTHRYWVLNDLEKRLGKLLRATAYDIILLDFIDERCKLAEVSNGSVITLSNEFKKAGINETDFKIIRSTSDHHFRLWTNGIAHFQKTVDVRKVFVNKVYYSEKSDDGSVFDRDSICRFNAFLERLYDYIRQNCGFSFIEFDKFVFTSDASHKWGKDPFHYIHKYYEDAVFALDRIETKLHNV